MSKERHGYYQAPEQASKMEVAMKLSNCISESDFVRTAIDFYIGYLYQQESLDYLSPVINRSIKNVIGGVEKNVCDMLFKLAVDTGMTTQMAVDLYDFPEGYYDDLRQKISQQVAETNGTIDFEKQKSMDE
jgi:hypothetical protein